jgi:hypothetical protein
LSQKDGWERFNAKDYPGGQAAWVRDLLAGKFLPLGVNPATELVYSPEPYARGEGQIESFLTQHVYAQEKVNASLAAVAAGADLDVHFPKRVSSCMRFGRCEMWQVCWQGGGNNPLSIGYVPRKSSLDKQKEKGLIVDGI